MADLYLLMSSNIILNIISYVLGVYIIQNKDIYFCHNNRIGSLRFPLQIVSGKLITLWISILVFIYLFRYISKRFIYIDNHSVSLLVLLSKFNILSHSIIHYIVSVIIFSDFSEKWNALLYNRITYTGHISMILTFVIIGISVFLFKCLSFVTSRILLGFILALYVVFYSIHSNYQFYTNSPSSIIWILLTSIVGLLLYIYKYLFIVCQKDVRIKYYPDSNVLELTHLRIPFLEDIDTASSVQVALFICREKYKSVYYNDICRIVPSKRLIKQMNLEMRSVVKNNKNLFLIKNINVYSINNIQYQVLPNKIRTSLENDHTIFIIYGFEMEKLYKLFDGVPEFKCSVYIYFVIENIEFLELYLTLIHDLYNMSNIKIKIYVTNQVESRIMNSKLSCSICYNIPNWKNIMSVLDTSTIYKQLNVFLFGTRNYSCRNELYNCTKHKKKISLYYID